MERISPVVSSLFIRRGDICLVDFKKNEGSEQDRLEELKYKLREIMSVPGYAIKFKDYLRTWVQKKREEVEESTYNAINYSVEGKILPFFEPFNLALSEVKPKHLNDLYYHLYLHGKKTRRDSGLRPKRLFPHPSHESEDPWKAEIGELTRAPQVPCGAIFEDTYLLIVFH